METQPNEKTQQTDSDQRPATTITYSSRSLATTFAAIAFSALFTLVKVTKPKPREMPVAGWRITMQSLSSPNLRKKLRKPSGEIGASSNRLLIEAG